MSPATTWAPASEEFLRPADHLHGKQRVAAEMKEVVVNGEHPDSQQLRPECHQLLFDFVPGTSTGDSGRAGASKGRRRGDFGSPTRLEAPSISALPGCRHQQLDIRNRARTGDLIRNERRSRPGRFHTFRRL